MTKYVTQSDKMGLIACQILTIISNFICRVDNYMTFHHLCEIYGDLTETYRIVIAYTEIEIHIVKQEHVFSGYKPYFFVRPGHVF